jgi:hypothetical protein
MAGASDYMVGATPDIQHAGNYAQMLMQGLSALPGEYYKGQENRYQQRQRDLFQDPDNQAALDDAIKTGKYGPVLQKMIQSGGASTGMGAIPILQKQPFLDAALQDIRGGNNSQPWWANGGNAPSSAASSSAAAGPANVTRQPQQGQPQLSATGSDSTGAETVRSLTAGMANGRDVPPTVMNNLARTIGVNDLDAPLNSAQEQRLRQIGGNYFRGSIPNAQPAGAATQPNPVSQPGLAGDENNTNQGTPVGATGGSPISPAPTSGSGGFGGAPARPPAAAPPGAMIPQGQPQGQPQGGMTLNDRLQGAYGGLRPAPAPGSDPAAGIVPPGFKGDSRDFAAAARIRAEALRRQANTAGIVGIPSKAKEDQALALDKQADAIDEAWKKAAEATPEQKNVASGAALQQEQIKDDTTRYGKQLAGIQGSAQAANRQLEHVQLAEGLYKNPDFYSGTGESVNLGYKRALAALGIDPGRSLPQEAFRKTMAAAVLNQVEQLKDDTAAVGGGGRIFQAQIELMEKAANNPDNSIAANRLLTEISKRSALEAKTIAQMANNYKGGHLDAGFAQMIDDHYSKHPMFTDGEMRDIRLIAPPAAPKLDSHDQAAAWARKAGLKPGDPMKLPSGRIVPAP